MALDEKLNKSSKAVVWLLLPPTNIDVDGLAEFLTHLQDLNIHMLSFVIMIVSLNIM